ncbi:hypothetical protein [Flaviaesturariibacter amylovorans]|uniref:Uncharacterized protein n=1 Tax=Flaviaesturariibacter amylovorans TaxID=1084520 RepID=A0ABP8GEH8_9BACT
MAHPLEQLSSELDAASAQLEVLRRAEVRRNTLEANIRDADRELEGYAGVLKKEEQEFRRIEGLTLHSLFYKVLGSREQQLDKERQEYLAARLRYDEALARRASLLQDLEAARETVAGLSGVRATHAALLARKEAQLLSSGDAAAQLLSSENDRLRDLQAEINEIREAELAGNEALRHLDLVRHHLEKASDWGTWDLWGGDTFATWGKHDNIDDARMHLGNAQYALQRFRNELSDLGRRLEHELDLNGLTTFADYFFDNLITDWVVQQRIHRSLEAATEVCARVQQLLYDLGRRRMRLQDEERAASDRKAGLMGGR